MVSDLLRSLIESNVGREVELRLGHVSSRKFDTNIKQTEGNDNEE